MVRDLRQLYVIIKDNEVVDFSTNMSAFVRSINDMGISDRNYAYFKRKFDASNKMTVTGSDGCEYHLQKIK